MAYKMKIISTNISKVITILHNKKEIKTGIFKSVTDNEIVITKTNIIGDEQADLVNHGGEHKAVYAFSSDHYEYWKKELKNEKLSFGMFGENFTISNLSEKDIHIGEQFRIGTALLEVSQPRVPCFKLGIALDNKSILKLFTQHHCTGVYFRVIEPGIVKKDDELIIEKEVEHNISIKKLFQAYFDKSYIDYESVLSEAYSLKELAPEWKEKIRKKLSIN